MGAERARAGKTQAFGSAQKLSFQLSRQLLNAMAARLGPLLPEITFVGGCTMGLLVTDPAASPVRATDDVDVTVEVGSYAEHERTFRSDCEPRFFQRRGQALANLPMADQPHKARSDDYSLEFVSWQR